MAKMSKKELLQKISDSVENQDIAISLMEDISDSMTDEEIVDNTILEKAQADLSNALIQIDELKEKYKERFLSSDDVKKPEEETIEEPEEANIIDVKEI